jgi:hypothetical protein
VTSRQGMIRFVNMGGGGVHGLWFMVHRLWRA